MSFKGIHLVNFRSYKEQEFEFSKGVNVIEGPNGSGKTNILEAVFVLANTKSFRASDKELVKTNEEWFKLTAEYNNKQLEVRYDPAKQPPKQLLTEGKKTSVESFVGKAQTVLFEPGMLEIVYGSPEQRRKFLDSVLSLLDKRYFKDLINYKRVLKQRNALLREGRKNDIEDQVFAWDIKLVELADYLVSTRRKFVDYINQELGSVYSKLSGAPEALSIEHISINARDYATTLASELSRRLRRDSLLGYTTVGPHRDDFEVIFKDEPAANIVSRGEARSMVLALKLTELKYLKKQTNTTPTLLLDDVFSELDEKRQKFLLEALGNQQTIITTTHLSKIKKTLPSNFNNIKLKKA